MDLKRLYYVFEESFLKRENLFVIWHNISYTKIYLLFIYFVKNIYVDHC